MEKTKDFIAQKNVEINAPVDKVWDALINPTIIKEYMFGTVAKSEWKEGSKITWEGEWQGKSYMDKGVILKLKPGKLLQYTHFSESKGVPDVPENYHTVTIELNNKGNQTLLTLHQDNNPTEEAKNHVSENWEMMLSTLKKYVEKKNNI